MVGGVVAGLFFGGLAVIIVFDKCRGGSVVVTKLAAAALTVAPLLALLIGLLAGMPGADPGQGLCGGSSSCINAKDANEVCKGDIPPVQVAKAGLGGLLGGLVVGAGLCVLILGGCTCSTPAAPWLPRCSTASACTSRCLPPPPRAGWFA